MMTDRTQPTPQLPELQSLRGFAAVTVMIHHGLRTLTEGGWAWAASEVPLNARAAVVLFFVLSGYVLGLSLMRRGVTANGLIIFYVRRVCRIYPALWVALLFGAAYLWLAQPLPAPDLAPWAQRHYDPAGFGLVTVLGSVVGANNYLLPTAWTITVELAASLLLPAIVYVMVRWRALALPLTVVLLALGLGLGLTLRQVPFYIGAFALGAALACMPGAARFRPAWPLTLAAAGVLMFSQLVLPPPFNWSAMLAETFASAVVIAGIAAHRVAWMRATPMVAIGDWSYSIYLLHLPIAYTITRLVDGTGFIGADRNVWALFIAIATTVVTIPLAALVYRFVELPGIAAGGAILRRRRDRQDASTPGGGGRWQSTGRQA
jgi:peptidoglycan/LPS O-acetylase OafA/YrhL